MMKVGIADVMKYNLLSFDTDITVVSNLSKRLIDQKLYWNSCWQTSFERKERSVNDLLKVQNYEIISMMLPLSSHEGGSLSSTARLSLTSVLTDYHRKYIADCIGVHRKTTHYRCENAPLDVRWTLRCREKVALLQCTVRLQDSEYWDAPILVM